MYISKIEKWDWEDWQQFFAQYKNLTKDNRIEIMDILTRSDKKEIEYSFPRLIDLWLINWIWPWWFISSIRKFISWLFNWVRYEWHDIMYAIWWNEQDRHNADYWLFKYSVMSIEQIIEQARFLLSPFSLIFIYIALYIQLSIAFLCYMMVVLFWWITWSFRYVTKK